VRRVGLPSRERPGERQQVEGKEARGVQSKGFGGGAAGQNLCADVLAVRDRALAQQAISLARWHMLSEKQRNMNNWRNQTGFEGKTLAGRVSASRYSTGTKG
jgi:hypothetical protein